MPYRELDLIFTEAEPITLKYRSVLHEVEDPALVYLTLLLHDIGKAVGIKNHSESGVRAGGPHHGAPGGVPEGPGTCFICDKESSRDGTILAEAGCR